MKRISKQWLAWLMTVTVLASLLCGLHLPVQADTVNYRYSGSYVYNWGEREEVATYLSPMAEDFYSDNGVTYEGLSALAGSSSTSNVSTSALYKALANLMYGNLDNPTSYNATRDLFKYTDCENNGSPSSISSFYTGAPVGPAWDSGKTWNREHCWPNSKSNGGSNSNTQRETDIMMLRPTSVSENSGRSNTAYGEGAGYYHPNVEGDGTYDLRGDVARIVLYVYVCYGTSPNHDGALNYMWGNSGVIESKDVLLKWMAQDPVDTWELGRNDSVEAITGTRNVFVDYPELAYDLFETAIPADFTSPSRGDMGGGSDSEDPVVPKPEDPTPPSGNGTATITFDSNSKRTHLSTEQQVWQENNITVTNNKGTTDVAGFFYPVRFYKSSQVIVAHPGMTQIAFTCNTADYAATLAACISGASVNGQVVTVPLRGVDSFSCTLSVGQVRVDSITVTYSLPEICNHAYDNACDTDCNLCGEERVTTHAYVGVITTPATCGTAGVKTYTCSVCGDSYTEAVASTGKHTYTADCDTFCNGCGAERTVGAGGEYSLSFASIANRTSYSTAQQVWQQNGIIVTNNKAASQSNVGNYSNPARFYAGSDLIVAYKGMTKIVFTCSGSSYTTALKNSIKTGTVTSSGSTVTVTFSAPVDTFTITKLTAQVRMSSLKVTAAGAKHVFTNDSDPDCNVCGTLRLIDSIRLYDEQVPTSRMEMDGGLGGLAFKFEAYVSGATKNDRYEGDLSVATVNYGDVTCKVLAIGAVMSNDPTVGGNTAKMVRESVKADKTVVDVPARLLHQAEEDFCTYAVRITNVPEKHFDTAIYARPYCVIEYNGQILTVYDDIVSTTYNG